MRVIRGQADSIDRVSILVGPRGDSSKTGEDTSWPAKRTLWIVFGLRRTRA